MHEIIFCILCLPLLGFLINGFFRNVLSKPFIKLIGVGSILISFILSIILFFKAPLATEGIQFSLFPFIATKDLVISFSFLYDALTAIFLLIITGIGFLIHLYSTIYMGEESNAHYARFFAYMNLFVFSMLLLVLGGNFLILFMGWEGVGLCSYLLIGFWFKNTSYNNAAKKAFVMNRIGDMGFLLALFWLIYRLHTLDFTQVFAQVSLLSSTDLVGITILLLIGAIGKSAQIPLYTWLPDAMAGPTPVSALIHAATMVTAGIYMITRTHLLYQTTPITLHIILIIGTITALWSATIALKQYDIKKILAYSTVSQLGYMFMALGAGGFNIAVFHVMTHAFFKALLFLGAGAIIFALHHEQDIRKMGGLRKKLPITHFTFLIACLAIIGMPPFSGFFSKDEILAQVAQVNIIYWVLGVLGAVMTTIYMFRLYTMVFLGNFRGHEDAEHPIHELPFAITIPLLILALLSFVGGWINIPSVLGGTSYLNRFLYPVLLDKTINHEINNIHEILLMVINCILVIITMILVIVQYKKHPDLENKGSIGRILEKKLLVDELYQAIFVCPLLTLATFFKSTTERWMEQLLAGIGRFLQYLSGNIRYVQSGKVNLYSFYMILGWLIFLLLWFYEIFIGHLFLK